MANSYRPGVTGPGSKVNWLDPTESPVTFALPIRAAARTDIRCCGWSPGFGLRRARTLRMRNGFPVNSDRAREVRTTWPPPSPKEPSMSSMRWEDSTSIWKGGSRSRSGSGAGRRGCLRRERRNGRLCGGRSLGSHDSGPHHQQPLDPAVLQCFRESRVAERVFPVGVGSDDEELVRGQRDLECPARERFGTLVALAVRVVRQEERRGAVPGQRQEPDLYLALRRFPDRQVKPEFDHRPGELRRTIGRRVREFDPRQWSVDQEAGRLVEGEGAIPVSATRPRVCD